MTDDIHVKVHSYGSGRPLALVYFDPTTGKKVNRSSGTRDPREAERRAAVLEDELRTGRYAAPSRVTWADFRERYEREKVAALARGTQSTIAVSLDHIERLINPDRLAKLTAAAVSRFQAKLREEGAKDTTIAHHLRNIKAALRWAAAMGMMAKAPAIDMPKVVKGQAMMRGRPITQEEFERMQVAARKLRPQDGDAWCDFLEGLWLSGLRLEEACALSWDEDAPFSIDLTGRRPAFRIYAEAQKARRDELLPMTPDFAQWILERTPEAERQGKVFKLATSRDRLPFVGRQVGRMISRIGRKAAVVVNKADGKYASAHDLRRAFGTRWAKRVMPAVLQRLMRHADIGTTMKYYVSASAADVADALWGSFSPAPKAVSNPGTTSCTTSTHEEENRA